MESTSLRSRRWTPIDAPRAASQSRAALACGLLCLGLVAPATSAFAQTKSDASTMPTSEASTNTASATGANEEPLRVLLMNLKAVGVDPGVVTTIDGILAVEVADLGIFNVVTGADMRQLAELETERTLAGCTDDSCLAEIADALGAERVIFGQVGNLGQLISITLNLYDAQKAKAVGRSTFQVEQLEQVPVKLRSAVRRLVGIEEPPQQESGSVLPVALHATGGGLVVAGALLAASSLTGAFLILQAEEAFRNGADGAIDDAKQLQDVWYGDVPLAAGLLAAGAVVGAVGLATAGGGFAVSLLE